MPVVYLDTSAFVKLYFEEDGTARVVELVTGTDGVQTAILDLALIESRSAIRRREREGDISRADADRILRRMQADASSSFLVQPSTSAVLEEAARLVDLYPLRAYEAIQLAGCLVLRELSPEPPTFVCADARLCEAAASAGLAVVDPVSR